MLEIVRAASAWDQRSEPIITFTMTDASKQRFAEFTTQNVGRKMDIRVDGRTMMSPVIREPILGSVGQISGRFTPAEAKALADRIASGASKVEVEAVPD